MKKTTYSDGTFTTTNYDAAGQVLSSVDARNNITTYTYDDAGRRLSVRNALNQIASFAYDPNGNQTSMTNLADGTNRINNLRGLQNRNESNPTVIPL